MHICIYKYLYLCVRVYVQVAAAGGTVQAECRLSLGPHSISTFKTLRVRVRMVSYVGPFQSAGEPRGDRWQRVTRE